MAKKRRYTTREFSYTRPILYQGEQYPSVDSVISDEQGNKSKGQIFVDAYGQYYTKDRYNNVFPVMPMEKLDEVNVNAPNNRKFKSVLGNPYLTISNDNVRVNNLPHREYNTSLKANAERGAREHALWDKEHPNLSAWRDAATAVPLAVTATPFVVGGGSALLNTGLGQAARYGLTTIMDNPYVAGINDAVGLGFAGKGMYDISQGKFTPETAMDIAGGYGLMFKGFNSLERFAKGRRAAKNAREANDVVIDPEGLSIMDDLNAQRAGEVRSASQDSNVSSRVISQPSTEEDDFYELFDYPVSENTAGSSNATRQANTMANITENQNHLPVESTEDMTSAVVPYLDEMLASRGIRTQSTLDRVREDTNARNIFNRTLQEQRAAQENNAPARLLDEYDNSIVQPNESWQHTTSNTEAPFLPDGTLNPNYSVTNLQDVGFVDINATPSEAVTSMEGNRTFELSKDKGPIKNIYFKARNVKAGEEPYTDDEINALVDATTGKLKKRYYF